MGVSVSATPSPMGLPRRGRGIFGRALIIGALLEIGLIGGFVWLSSQKLPPPPPKPKRIAVHMVQSAPPKPKPLPPPPKPVVQPKPIPQPLKPVPQPVPQPVPRPVVHSAPPRPIPLVVKAPAPTAPIVPPAPVTPLPPPAPSPALRQAAIARYAAMVRAQVQSRAHVPEAVRLMHLSGTAVIAFELTPSGDLVWARLSQSSGVSAIDRAALAAVRTGSYPAFTKNMPKHPTVFDVEVHLSSSSD